MKKFVSLVLAAALICSASDALAVDVRVSGMWMNSFTFADHMFGSTANGQSPLMKGSDDGAFNVSQRMRINFDLTAGEFLSGMVQLQMAQGEENPPYYNWGTGGVGGPGKSVTARLVYLDWLVPNTELRLRMGRQEVFLPSYTFAGPILGTMGIVDGVTANMPINDAVGLNFGWLRPGATVNKWGTEHTPHSSVDLAYLSADFSLDGMKISPWGMVGLRGSNSPISNLISDFAGAEADNAGDTVYWVGIGGELTMFDPFKITADFLYSGNNAGGAAERSGWYAALGAELKNIWGTPFVRGWYASGDDADSEGSGRMLNVGNSGDFDASAIYFYANALNSGTISKYNPAGTWGVQVGVKDVSFVEKLTHRLSLTYFQGTNNTNRITDPSVNKPVATSFNPMVTTLSPVDYMTTADSAWEVDLLNSFKLYRNLTANVLLAYLVTDYDEEIRTAKYGNAFRCTFNLNYVF